MQLFLSKLIPVFIMPLGLVVLFLLITIFLLLFDKRKTALVVCLVQFGILGVCSAPVVGEFFVGSW